MLRDIELLEVDQGAMQKLGLKPPSSTSLILLTPNTIKHLASSPDLSNLLTHAQNVFTDKRISTIPPFHLHGGGLSTLPRPYPAPR